MRFTLKKAVWEITLACCFSCRYCGSKGGKAREGELSTEECLSVAEQLAELGCRRVSLIGGEVFMRRDWKVIAGRMNERGIRVNIITNGFLFPEKLIADLKDVNIESVSVSLDGPKEVHDRYRQEGSYDRAVRAIEVLREGGIPVSVISTLNAEGGHPLRCGKCSVGAVCPRHRGQHRLFHARGRHAPRKPERHGGLPRLQRRP